MDSDLATPPAMLKEIIAHKREELAQRRAERPLEEINREAARQPPPRDFATALRRTGPLRLLAEVKRGSPSKGLIDPDAKPEDAARVYASAGADAVSVLTDEKYFMGHDSHVDAIKAACDRPVLRKDFTLNEYHVHEARSIGADAVLLMAQVLSPQELADLLSLTHDLGMEALVECHEPDELESILATPARVLGINNRDLWTLEIDMDTTLRLIDQVPEDRIVVSQSGFTDRTQVERVEATRVDAIQVGTSLMASGDLRTKIRELMGQNL